MITLQSLNKAEAVRYLGGAGVAPNDAMNALLDDCERELLSVIDAKYLYRVIDLPCGELTQGQDIKKHLAGCQRAAVLCATLGAGVDRLLRVSQIADMSRAVVLNSLAAAAIEQVCDRAEQEISRLYPGYHMTFRFSPGYGDYPIQMQKYYINELDAQRKIGLSTNESYILVPAKSVTAVIGLSPEPIEPKKRGCAVCNMRATCQYRSRGEHCGF